MIPNGSVADLYQLPEAGMESGLKFSQRQIELAKQFKQLGLVWEPLVAHGRLVTHSMGGIIARRALMQTRPEKLRSLAMLFRRDVADYVAAFVRQRRLQ